MKSIVKSPSFTYMFYVIKVIVSSLNYTSESAPNIIVDSSPLQLLCSIRGKLCTGITTGFVVFPRVAELQQNRL
jgi:hypothetical protein